MSNNIYNNPNEYARTSGAINVAELMGASDLVTYNGQKLSYAQYISKVTQNILLNNSYEASWTSKGFKTIEVGNYGTRQYEFKPANLPVSNYSQSDQGNRSFATAFQVYGKPIMFLQTNFWTNEFVNMTAPQFISGIQEELISSLNKSIPIVKTELGFMEFTLFALASGQFFFADEMGKNVADDPNDPNSLNLGQFNILWSTQAPRLQPTNTLLGNTQQAFLKQEFDNMSKWLMKFPMSVNMWAVGYDINKIHIDCSYYMRTNLATAINLGWPTNTNKDILENKSFEGATISQWLNILLTDTGTYPHLQNVINQVVPEVQPSTSGSGSPLGYGINNVCSFDYLRNVIATISHEGSIESYVTPYVPFNPYTNSKTFYRLGGTFGWGQVHLPILSATNYAILDPSAYITINSFTTMQGEGGANQDWMLKGHGNAPFEGQITYEKTLNGNMYILTFTVNIDQLLDDMTQAQAIENQWEPGMCYNLYNFPQLPTAITDVIPCAIPNFTFAQWAMYRSFRGLTYKTLANGKNVSLMDLFKVGDNQLTFAPFDYTFNFPKDTPVV